MSFKGLVRKLSAEYSPESGELKYFLNLNNKNVLLLNDLIGKEIHLNFTGNMFCTHCGKRTPKTFNDGLCYGCFLSLPQADLCMMKPHECHYHRGTCRDEAWAQQHCFQPHTLYLSRSSHVKIGITRTHQQFTRWLDQGASEAMAIGIFPNRREVGYAEYAVSAQMSDKTSWQKMLKNIVDEAPFEQYLELAKSLLTAEQKEKLLDSQKVYKFNYPVEKYPEKVSSLKLEKIYNLSRKLSGIKGQYLIFDDEVINIRAHSGFEISVEF